jgi:hypothetical protein
MIIRRCRQIVEVQKNGVSGPGSVVGSSMGTFQLVKDKLCTKCKDGQEMFSEGYRIGEDTYELWIKGSDGTFYPAGTYYRLKQRVYSDGGP